MDILQVIIENKILSFLFGGCGVTLVVGVYKKLWPANGKEGKNVNQKNHFENTMGNNSKASNKVQTVHGNVVTNINNFDNTKNEFKETNDNIRSNSMVATKATLNRDDVKILFIDDQEFPLVKICIEDGWRFTKLIKDASSLTMSEIVEANIIFVDIHGVGQCMGFNSQGLGLAAAIKDRYENKIVIIYSAEPKGEIFSADWNKIDDRILKNSDPYLFLTKIEEYAKKISNN